MAEETTAIVAHTHVDSLLANEFTILLNGETVKGVFKVSGLLPFKLEVKPSLTKLVRDPFKLSKMVQRDPELPFNRWLRETIAAKDDIVRPTRTLEIIAIDDGEESRRWTVKGAWISEISYSDFSSASSDLIEETVTIHYDDILETWQTSA
ncbi:MAG TPA: phage tail protein [Phototrophicaceae bacterium]|nr:phage tail protein [Phototrophicaceae bacterium]